MEDLRQQIEKRRTFAIISHPDAGKTTQHTKPTIIKALE